ncbi:MAG: WYL domain-containing protein [Acidocella sp.]|nr:WYL domain-containing protein [Acidocella sp.]
MPGHTRNTMRYEPAQRLLRLAILLAGRRVGLSLDEIARELDIGRRTAERLRDSLIDIFPQLESYDDEERVRRWRLPQGALVDIAQPRPEILAAVDVTARELERHGEPDRAELLREASSILRAFMNPKALTRTETDVAALMEAEGTAMRPGPRPKLPPRLLPTIRRAILGVQLVAVRYAGADGSEPATRILCPYGILHGGRGWLVAHVEGLPEMRLWRLDRIVSADLLERGFNRQEFDLAAYAAQSFGVFQEPPMDVVLRFTPDAADDAEGWLFHPTQTMEREADGSLLVKFRAGGAREICWHLFTWGAGVKILKPKSLNFLMNSLLIIEA